MIDLEWYSLVVVIRADRARSSHRGCSEVHPSITHFIEAKRDRVEEDGQARKITQPKWDLEGIVIPSEDRISINDGVIDDDICRSV